MTLRPVLRLPARTLVPALITVVALVMVGFDHMLQRADHRLRVEQEQKQLLVERLGIEQSAFDDLILQNRPLQLRRAVAELALRPHLTHAYLTAPGGRIVGSLARADLGQSLPDVLAADTRGGAALLEAPRAPDNSLSVQVDASRTALTGLMTLEGGHQLLVRSDLTQPFSQRLHASRVELWRHAVLILCWSLLLSLFLHLIWFRRAAQLTNAARAFGQGRLDTRVDLGGRDELAEIGSAFNDMAVRLQAQHAALLDSERQFRAMFEQAGVGVARIDSRLGHFMSVNKKYSEIMGYDDADMRRLDFMRLTHPEDLPANLALLDSLKRGDIREYSIEKRVYHKDGHAIWVAVSVSPLWAPGAVPDYHLAVIQDITARREAEQALKLERNRLSAAEHIAALGSWEFHRATGSGWWSEQMYAFFGLDPADGVPEPEPYLKLVHPEDRTRVAGVMALFVQGATEVPVHVYRTSPDAGPVRHLRPSVQTVTDDDGGVVKYVGTLLDVTYQFEAEQALRASEERLRATLEQAPNVAVQWFDAQGRVLYWNGGSTRLYGWTPDEAIGRSVDNLTHTREEADAFRDSFAQIARSGQSIGPSEYLVRHRDGSPRWIEATLFSIPGLDKDPIMVCMDVDITARHNAERAVEQERTHLRTLFATLPDLVWLKSPEGVYLSCNRQFERLCGRAEAELLGRTDYELFSKEEADLFRSHDELAMRTGQNSVNEEWVTMRETGERMRLQTIKTPMHDADGKLVGVLGIARDITEFRETQDSLRELNRDLEQRVADRTQALSDAMKELESFSYAVSHDLKAPLRGIDGYSKILLEDYGDRFDEQGQRFLANIRNGTRQMHALIEDLLAYSRMERRSLEASRVDLGEVMRNVLHRRSEEIAAASVQIVGEVPSITVRADHQGVEMVLRNLLDNALKFSRDATPAVVTLHGAVRDGRAHLSVRDNGIGFDMKYHERIFEIFQRLHRNEEFSGTGVGLALVRKAMQRMDGRVWAESVPGEGATFHLEFPA
ncbi:MAG: PAS domain S-box protein [Methyloversatilis sp.]|uniref:PAS domain S-box protein n=1 Tax=Methyloversatilis sp. TaxID=2569862 RepID=UPI002734AC8F|nr:PAS domain S-box protein [Methyloversatilis sp.]MDP3873601.1 PAS domain S-box protein [Methyloversatilis sp.]